jgi:hypothetical protein
MKIVERMYRRLSSLRKDLTNNLFSGNAPIAHVHRRLSSLRYVLRGERLKITTRQTQPRPITALVALIMLAVVFVALGHATFADHEREQNQEKDAGRAVIQMDDMSTALQFSLREAPELLMPGAHEFGVEWGVDGNSPAERNAAGRLTLFNSLQFPWCSIGPDIFNMTPSERVTIIDRESIEGGLWLEATYRDQEGNLLGWFHNEVSAGCSNTYLAVPRIRQMISRDDGMTWEDLGVILAAPSDSLQCETANYFFAGGHGDFSVIFDPVTQYFYFYFSTYHREQVEQGIAVARLHYGERNSPMGNVWKWYGGGWNEPGIGGHVSPIFSPASDWHHVNANAYWGPAIHFNTHLRQYVMLLNHAVNEDWWTEGIYVGFNAEIGNPSGWSDLSRLPLEIESPHLAYPQVIGLKGDGTDKVAGQVARLFLWGQSYWEIVFEHPIGERKPRDPDDTDDYPHRSPL